MQFDPSDFEIQPRKKSKLGPQQEEIEPAISSVGVVPDLTKKPVPLRGGFKALQDKGFKITNYKTTEKE
jgi:hypothetical protein